MALRRFVVPTAAVLLLAGVQTQAQPPAAEEPQPAFRLRTDAVIVDVVVRGDATAPPAQRFSVPPLLRYPS